jgi:hypothetical protein
MTKSHRNKIQKRLKQNVFFGTFKLYYYYFYLNMPDEKKKKHHTGRKSDLSRTFLLLFVEFFKSKFRK